ncbi:MAG: TonB C-terminal domain-containing protein [Candidatus Hydrogenedentales bacterium]|jgi:outer membrane biosynthesis protein TonB
MHTRESDNYGQRMLRSSAAAVVIHMVLIVLFSAVGAMTAVDAIGPHIAREEPLVLNLEPDPQSFRHFVDTAVPATSPVDPDTDLISDRASKASGLHDSEGERPGPRLQQSAEVDDLAGSATPAPVVAPAPPAAQPEAAEEPAQPDTPATTPESPAQPQAEALTALARVGELRPSVPAEAPEPAPQQMAQAEPQPTSEPTAMPQPHLGVSKARPGAAAPGKGFLGFEALEHELGPYLKEVRDRVERNWRTALEMRFSGVSRTQAILDCAISPQGKLVRVKVVEPGDSPTFAVLCKQAIEKAAPFSPFPFDVPAIYRSQNLEIRWTFSYL